jgi:hypothetical protein
MSCLKSAEPVFCQEAAEEAFLPSCEALGTYIGDSDTKNQSEDNITANVLILDSEPLCLQGANSDGESSNEVEKDHGRKGIANGRDGGPELQHCQNHPELAVAARGEVLFPVIDCVLTCSGATGAIVVNIRSDLWVDTINGRRCAASYRRERISQSADGRPKANDYGLENLKLHGLARSSQRRGRRWPVRLRQTKGRNERRKADWAGLMRPGLVWFAVTQVTSSTERQTAESGWQPCRFQNRQRRDEKGGGF